MPSMSNPTHAISINPATGEEIGAYPYDTQAVLHAVLDRAAAAFGTWRLTSAADRCAMLKRLGEALRADIDRLAGMITAEMGKPIAQARGEIEKCAATCAWYAENGARMVAPEPTSVENDAAWIEFRPLGTVLAVMPWNFPIWQVIRSVVPALVSGNTYVLKHAPNVMGSAYLLREACARAGLPDGVFQVANLSNDLVSEAIADDRIAAVTLTGSVRAGAAIGAQAGQALKKCVLELGGSDPFIVLPDADLGEAVRAAVLGRFQNTGQVCAAAKRFIVHRDVADAFTERFIAGAKALVVGSPADAATYIGPMARFDLRDELHNQVQRSIREGAELLLGGRKLDGPGNFYEPTVLANVTAGMTSFREEMFGPVASIIRADDADHALALANDSQFGLTATVYAGDPQLARRLAARLEVGGIFINGYSASDPRLAFGGVKKSGFGRELSHFGVREFCNVQTVWLDRK
ncbi:succinate-semialdehyde dehydrogenase [Bordetella genomosp. 9]|uniref:Succinate-semialdehyde dehydrogenase n=2 Tax=Bordetella genomosp. 9 TaxID=1416803 RepID=A0A261RNC0_9BORD|nr:succinate-semialdehyde dehydrogenase [Bordetella genomosp. 9]